MKLTQLIKIITAGSLLCSMASTAMASTIILIPSEADYSGNETGVSHIYTEIADLGITDVKASTLMYKDNVGGSEAGTLSSSYTTVFSNTPEDPQNATITYDGGNIVDDAWLLVKDGNETPAWYLFNLSSTGLQWNGTDTLKLQDFWPGSGAISHVALYGTSVPDSGATIALMGIALAGLGLLKRRQ